MQQFEPALQAISGCVHNEDLTSVIHALARQLGYAGFVYVLVKPQPPPDKPRRFFLSTLRANFIETYRRENFANYDPAFFRAATTNAPFTWTDCPEFQAPKRRRRGPKPKAQKIIETANDFGYTQGFLIPMHSVDTRGELTSAFISLFWQDSLARFNPQETTPLWLRLVGLSFHEKVMDLQGIAPQKQAPLPSLTDRERDCLAWACQGKTLSETGLIMRLSERTIEFHIQNAMRKLGVHTKTHAIAVAIHRGLIFP